MKFAMIAANQITIMFIIMLLAIFLYKIKMIDDHTNKSLSNILLMVINPFLLFISYQTEYNTHLVKGLFISFGLAVISIVLSMGISYLMIPKTEKTDFGIERFSAIYSNCGFFGIPLINSMFGSEGVFYLTAYMTVFNLLIWSQGVSMMTGKKSMKDMLKAFESPAVVAVILGMICFFLKIQIPEILLKPVKAIADMNTPFAMIVAGVAIAQSNFVEIIKKRRIYLISLVKLLVEPIVLILIFKGMGNLNIPNIILITTIVETACPAATTATMFAIKFDRDYKYSSEIFAVTTIFSLVTIPIVLYLTEFI